MSFERMVDNIIRNGLFIDYAKIIVVQFLKKKVKTDVKER